jgi:potassium-transporting ATPase ATP-binding subunit
MSKKKSNILFESSLVKVALLQSFVKLNPSILLRNPVMFTVEIGTAIMLGVCFWILAGEGSQGSFAYNFAIFIILFLTVCLPTLLKRLLKREARPRPTV